MSVIVQAEPFDAGAVLTDFTEATRGAGAIVSFSGITRDIEGGLQAMEIEHYPGMTERALKALRAEALDRFALTDAWILHRFGSLGPDEPIMMVLAAAPHRREAFQAAEFLMDYLKSRAPFWKREIGAGGAGWVAAKDADEMALDRWSKPTEPD